MVHQNAAEKCPPGRKKEADPSSSSSLLGQPRVDQARRRSWRRRAQDSGSQAVKPIRLNRVPLLHAEISNPSTTTQGVRGLSQGVVLVSSSSSNVPCQKQSLKRGHQEGTTEPQIPKSPAAKRRRIDDVPAQSAVTSSSSTASQVALRLSQDTQSPSREAAPYRPPWLFPSSMKDRRSQPGPIRMRHVWRQLRLAKKPYCRPENQSRTRQASPLGARHPQPSK